MSVSLEQFTANIVLSGLMPAGDLAAFQNSLPADRKPADAKALAGELVRVGKLTKYQAQCIYSGRTTGLVVDQYVVLDKIGEGGMGVVLKGQHLRMKRSVAIKALQTRRLGSADAVQRFHREVEAAAKLTHQNIVMAYDAREQDGVHYFIMEFVDGRDLASTLHELGSLPVHQAIDCALQTARGLEYAHSLGIVHRDIKPANLLLSNDGTVKILDMGLALLSDADAVAVPGSNKGEQLTRTGDVMGTCDYMAPEQGLDAHNVDGRADIYALGCTLFRLLTGQRPYSGDSMVQVLLAHRNSPIPSLRALKPEVPAELDAACQKMMAKRPKDRFASMTEVIAALEAVLHPPRPSSTSFDDDESTNTRSLRDNLSFLQSQPAATVTAKPVDAFRETVTYHQELDTGSSSAAQRAPLDDNPVHDPPVTPPPIMAKPQAAALSGKTAARTSGSHALKARKTPVGLIAVALASLAAIAGGGAFAIYTLSLGNGTVVIENDADLSTKDVEVTATRGEEVKVASKQAGWTITLKPGEYNLSVKGTVVGGNDHIELSENNITVTRGSKQLVKIKLVAPKADPEGNEARKLQEQAAKELGKSVEYNNSIGMKFVLVPSGAFVMGSPTGWITTAAGEKGEKWFAEPHPEYEGAHHVRITRPFYLGVYEVTQGQYQDVMGVNPSHFGAGGDGKGLVVGQDTRRLPVESVSYDDGVEFCKRLSARTDEHRSALFYRLPTEAEWEYACRAGTTTVWHFGNDGSNLGLYGWYKSNSLGTTHEVGKLRPNPWGLYDMYGNVWEWCADRYLDTYYGVTEGAADPVNSSTTLEEIVARGGGYVEPAGFCRSGLRHAMYPGSVAPHYGFRVLLEIGPSHLPEEPKAAPPKASVATETEWTEWKDLFDGKTLDGWQQVGGDGYKEGHVKVVDGCIDLLVDPNKHDLAAIVATNPVPKVNYELLIEAKRLRGADCASIVFPIGEAHCAFFAPSDRGDVRFRAINNNDTKENGTARPIDFKDDVWHKICLRVLDSQITASIDDQPLIELPTAGHLFSTQPNLNRLFPLGIFSAPGQKNDLGCNSQIRKIQIREWKPASTIAPSAGGLALPMKRPAPVHVEITPEPLPEFKPGQPMSKLALVTNPAPLPGVLSWTIETARHRGFITGIAFSPDGKSLALCGEDGAIRIVDPVDGHLKRALIAAQAIETISWSPDGKMLATRPAWRGPAAVWDVETGRMLRRNLFACDVTGIDWSPDGRRIAGLAAMKQDVVIADLVDGSQTAIPCQDGSTGTPSYGEVAWSPDGSALAYYRRELAGQAFHDVHVWNAQGSREIARVKMNSKWGTKLGWSPDGAMLACQGGNGYVVCDSRNSDALFRIQRDTAAWSPDGQAICFGYEFGLECRNPATWSVRWRLGKEGSDWDRNRYRIACSVSPDGKLVCASGQEGKCRILDATTGSHKTWLDGHSSFTLNHTFTISKDGSRFALRPDGRNAYVWDGECGASVKKFQNAGWSNLPVAISCDNSVIANGAYGFEINSLDSLAAVASIPYGEGPCRSLELSNNGKLLVVTGNSSISVYNCESHARLCNIRFIAANALAPDGNTLAIASNSGVGLYDPNSGELMRSLDGAHVKPWKVDWSPNGKLIAAASVAGGIDVWDVASGKHLGVPDALANADCFQDGRNVESLAWLDDRTIAVGNNAGVCVWSLDSRSIIREIPGGNYYWSMTRSYFAPAARKVAFIGSSAVHLRNLDDGRVLYTIVLLSDDPQKCAVVGPDGHWRGPMDDVRYVVLKTDGAQETLMPDEFEKKYHWKNDPLKAVNK